MRTQDVINWIEDLKPLIKECGSVEQGLIKFATEKNLSPSLLEKLAQMVNAGATVNYLDTKTASNRRGDTFKVVDVPELVAEYTKSSAFNEKKAHTQHKVVDRRFRPEFHQEPTLLEKEASQEQEVRLDLSQEKKTKQNLNVLRGIVDRTKEAKYAITDQVQSMFTYDHQHPLYEQFEKDAYYVFGDEAKEALDYLYDGLGRNQRWVKRASDEGDKRLVRPSEFLDLVEKTMLVLKSEKAASEILEKQAMPTETKEPKFDKATKKDHGFGSALRTSNNTKYENEALDLDDLTTDLYSAGHGAIGGMSEAVKNKGMLPSSWIKNTPVEALAVDHYSKLRRKVDGALQEAQYQAVLSDLLVSDELLQNEDEDLIAEKYQSLISMSPELARDKNVARVFLRSAIQHEGVDIFTAKEYIDAQNKKLQGEKERLTLSNPDKYMRQSHPETSDTGDSQPSRGKR